VSTTSNRLNLIRIDYAFTVIIPCLISIYIHNLMLINHLDILFGFIFLNVTASVINDAIDRKNPKEKDTILRTENYGWKELFALGIVNACLGIFLFIRTIHENFINGIIFFLIFLLIFVYCINKRHIIINLALLSISHIILPYMMILVDSGIELKSIELGEVCLVLTLFIFGLCGECVHEIIDEDAISKYSLKTQQKIVVGLAFLTIFLQIISSILLVDYLIIVIIIIPLGVIYTFRKPTKSTKGVKDIGIIMGNFVMILLLVIIIQQNYK